MIVLSKILTRLKKKNKLRLINIFDRKIIMPGLIVLARRLLVSFLGQHKFPHKNVLSNPTDKQSLHEQMLHMSTQQVF